MKPTCYVCQKLIQSDPQYIGNDKYRHKRCKPGQKRWMESRVGKVSPVRKYFDFGVSEAHFDNNEIKE